MAASRFKDTRLLCCLSVREAGKVFRVSERTIRNWEAGRVGIPYAAFKLLRILRGYELPGQAWKGFRLKGDTLWSPEGKGFKASDHTWWSLTVGMAHEFRRMMRAKRAASVAALEAAGAHAVALAATRVLESISARPVPIPEPFAPETITNGTVRAIDPPQHEGRTALHFCSESPFSNTGFVARQTETRKHAGVCP